MSVIVNHADPSNRTFELEAAIHAAKTVKRGTDLLHWNIERGSDRNRCRRIQHIVRARHVQGELAELFLFIGNLKTGERAVSGSRRRPS